jgi:hypothetical protein
MRSEPDFRGSVAPCQLNMSDGVTAMNCSTVTLQSLVSPYGCKARMQPRYSDNTISRVSGRDGFRAYRATINDGPQSRPLEIVSLLESDWLLRLLYEFLETRIAAQ